MQGRFRSSPVLSPATPVHFLHDCLPLALVAVTACAGSRPAPAAPHITGELRIDRNAAYQAAGVETIASTATAALIAERGPAVRAASAASFEDPALRSRVERVALLAPRRTFDPARGLTLRFGGEEVHVIYPGPAHSPDDVVVHFPARRLLFGGCMIKASGASIGYTGDADLRHWEAAVHSLEPLAPRVVVPGHGAVGGPELFAATVAIVRAAR